MKIFVPRSMRDVRIREIPVLEKSMSVAVLTIDKDQKLYIIK